MLRFRRGGGRVVPIASLTSLRVARSSGNWVKLLRNLSQVVQLCMPPP